MFSKRAEERRASLATIDNSYILKTRKVKQDEEELIWECIRSVFVFRFDPYARQTIKHRLISPVFGLI